ncbi:MAG: hypothetical protein F4X36_03225 [Gammaproteobacteria bacterium]|nr:hypothetical protein [Gammaproteobacteria bacterium]
MQRPIARPVGMGVKELDTPALVVDLGRLDTAGSAMDGTVRAAVWVHGTPALARHQVADPRVAGIAVRSVAEAEVFAAAGFEDIRILRPLVTEQARRRAAALAATARLVFEEDVPVWEDDALAQAVSVSTRVTSVPEPGRAITDCGQKAVGRDFGDPTVAGHPEWRAHAGSAEHGVVLFDPAERALEIGDWLRFVPADVATVFALHDQAYAVRAGVLEAVWQVSGRGAF